MSAGNPPNKNDGDDLDGFVKNAFSSFNRYATKKSIAQGFLDLALLFANIAQLKEIVKRDKDAIYYIAISAISISIILQILAGACIVVVGRMSYNQGEKKKHLVEKLNDITTGLLFLISTVNVVISMVWVFTDESPLVKRCD